MVKKGCHSSGVGVCARDLSTYLVSKHTYIALSHK